MKHLMILILLATILNTALLIGTYFQNKYVLIMCLLMYIVLVAYSIKYGYNICVMEKGVIDDE